MSVQFQEFMLKDNGQPLVMSDGKIICKVISQTGHEEMIPIDKNTLQAAGIEYPHESLDKENEEVCSNVSTTSEWSTEETRYLLDKYHTYLPNVGPMKTFRNKKAMWERISADLQEEINVAKTAEQCQNRYKTIMKRKHNASKINRTSGEERQNIEYEEELNKISGIDDSVTPEVLMSANKVVVNQKQALKKSKAGKPLHDLILKLHREKEEARQKRHEEKLDFLRGLTSLFKKNE